MRTFIVTEEALSKWIQRAAETALEMSYAPPRGTPIPQEILNMVVLGGELVEVTEKDDAQ